jgi:NADPH2:quinone reductase
MKAAVIQQWGEAPVLAEFSDPHPADGEVLVAVTAAGLHPIVRFLVSGRHYAAGGELPLIPGVDAVGRLEDGTRVYVSRPRPPYGTLAERAAVPRAMAIPLPDGADEALVAASINPAIGAYAALAWRAQLAQGETVWLLGATGAAGQLGIQLARRLGARRVLAAGRNADRLARLRDLGADAIIQLDRPDDEVIQAIRQAAGEDGVDVIIDFVWGRPAELTLAALTPAGMGQVAPRVRFVQVGELAGPTINLPAAVLRGSGVEMYGSGLGTIPFDRVQAVIPDIMTWIGAGELDLAIEQVPLSAVTEAWRRPAAGTRIVLVP